MHVILFYAISRKSQDSSVYVGLLFAKITWPLRPQCTLFFFMQFLENHKVFLWNFQLQCIKKHKTHHSTWVFLFAMSKKLQDSSVHLGLFMQFLENHKTHRGTLVVCLQRLENYMTSQCTFVFLFNLFAIPRILQDSTEHLGFFFFFLQCLENCKTPQFTLVFICNT